MQRLNHGSFYKSREVDHSDIIVPTSQGDVHIYAPAVGQFTEAKARTLLAGDPRLGLDTEGKALEKKSANQFIWGSRGLRLVQFGTERNAIVLNVSDPAQRLFSMDLLRSDHTFVAHNARHEITSLWCSLGVDIADRAYDTFIVSKLLDPGPIPSGRHGLKPLTQIYLDDILADAETALAQRFEEIFDDSAALRTWADGKKLQRKERVQHYGWNNIPVDDPTYLTYAGLDAIYARRLAPKLAEEAKHLGVYDAIPFAMRRMKTSARIAIPGWRIDREYTERLLEDYGGRNRAARKTFQDLYRMPTGSPKRVEWLESRGVVIEAMTDKGNPSLAAEELRRLHVVYGQDQEINQFLSLALQAAETQNVTQFAQTLLLHADGQDRVHAQINPLHAVSGRDSVTEPALQTVSWHNPIRGAFIPDDEDSVLASADLSQVEPRIYAYYADEQVLAEQVRAGIDVYSAVAEIVGNRKVAKRAVLGRAYGSGARTMRDQIQMLDGLPVTLEQVQEALSTIDKTYPGFRRLAKRLEREDPVRLESGRMVPVDPTRLYKNINSKIQGTAADLYWACVLRCVDAGFESEMRMPVHDEMIFSLPKADLDVRLKEVHHAFTRPFHWMPLDTEIEVYTGGRWMEGKQIWTPEKGLIT